MNSIIIGTMVALIAWLAMRSVRRMKAKHAYLRSEAEKKAIPRIGTPKTITKEQADRLRKNNFEPMKEWSFEEAELFLDTTLYLRAVFSKAAGLNDPPLEMQNALFGFILRDENLRDYMLRWGEERRNRGVNDEAVELSHDAEFERIAAEALGLAEKVSSTSPA
jgi:hypothetical protein